MLHLEIPWKEIDDLIKIKLKAAGFDLTKEIVIWSKFEEDKVTLVYEQKDDANLTEEFRMQQSLSNRPSYLDRMGYKS